MPYPVKVKNAMFGAREAGAMPALYQ